MDPDGDERTVTVEVGGEDARTVADRLAEELAGVGDPIEDGDGYRLEGEPEPAGTGRVNHRPYGPHGAMAIVVGFIFMIPTVFVSVLVSVLGYLAYRRQRRTELPLASRDVLRVTAADGAVTVALEGHLSIDEDRLLERGWTSRLAAVNYATHWHNVASGETVVRDADDSVVGHFTAWAHRDPEGNVAEVRELQTAVAADPAERRAYTDVFAELFPEAETALVDHLADRREETEAVLRDGWG